MCGIAGFVGTGTPTDLARMTTALVHRGPDGEGQWIDEVQHIFLGHRRLAIVDIAGGDQPMWNEDGQIGVIFNGEIYNHAELRAVLQGRGHRFASDHSDTEVLVHGYEEWGEGLFVKLNGMFACAILDRPRKRMVIARDRFGEKPLYYCARPGFFAFASELTALACHSAVPRSIDVVSVQKLFAYGYIPAPRAILEGVAKLPGGHWLRLQTDTGALVLKSYWRFSVEPDDAITDNDEPRLVEECAALIKTAAQRRLMSDVPLGVFLSGGLDSSTVLASLAQLRPAGTLSTFTIGFDEPSFDESEPARTVARYIGTDHHERRCDITNAKKLIPAVLGPLDEPLADASLLPTYLLCAFTRERVTVALSGDGGDELFAGYDPFLALKPAALYNLIMPRTGHSAMRWLVERLPVSYGNMSLDFKLRRSLLGLSHTPSVWLPVWMALLIRKDATELFETPLRLEEVYSEAIALWEADNRKSMIDRALEFFTRFYLQDDILAKVDRAAMMSSLETRAVFLDNDLVEFCCRLPSRFKLRGNTRKYLLKKVARRLLPNPIVDRKKKGFGIPLAKWMREMPEPSSFSPVKGLHGNYAKQSFAAHRSGKADNRLCLWSWLTVQGFVNQMQTLPKI